MRCEKNLSLLIFGIVILLFTTVYGAENHISIKPVGVAQPGLYEITLYGERDSDYAVIDTLSYAVTIEPNSDTYGYSRVLTLYPGIVEGDNPGRTQYKTTIKVYLEPGYYDISLQISDNYALPYYVDISNDLDLNEYSGFVVPRISELPINIENITDAAFTGSDSFILRGIKVPGYAESFWGNFQWNPYSYSFDLKDAGAE